MRSEHPFAMPPECRGFGNEYASLKRDVALKFISSFIEKVAPPMLMDDSNTGWTTHIRKRLRDICPLDCDHYPQAPTSSKGEFLVDFIWEENAPPRRILLACESEWGTDRYGENPKWRPVEADFEKLIALKASYKLLVFSSNYGIGENAGSSEGDFSIGFAKQRLEASLAGYGHHLPGETYIFIDFPRQFSDLVGGCRWFLWRAEEPYHQNVSIEVGDSKVLSRPVSVIA